MASQKLATSLMDKGFIREIRAKPDRARGLFGSKSVADEVHEVAHILLQTWPQQVAAPIANEIHDVLTQTTASRLPPDRPRLNLKASLDPSGRNQDSAIALLEMGRRDS
jgi:hypothetical protein